MSLEIHIEQDYSMIAQKVWVFEKFGNEIVHYNLMKNGEIVETRTPANQPIVSDKIKPFMIMPRNFGEAFLLSFTKALTDQGIRTENEHKLEGQLEATNKHLEDMRTVAFKGLKIEE